MEPYVYIEYPKCMYDAGGNTMTVDNREEEDAAAQMGWKDAAGHFEYPIEATGKIVDDEPPAPPAAPESPVIVNDDDVPPPPPQEE